MSIASRIENMTTNIENAYNSIEDLGIDLTNINKNIENISTKIDEIYNNYPKITGEGTSINLDNTKKARLTSTLKGNTSQDGEPTPDNPINVNVVSGDNNIVVEGKNLLPDEWTSGSISGSTGQVVNYDARIYTTNKIILDGNTTYCFKHNNTSTWQIRASIDEYDKDNNHLGRIGGINGSINGEFITQSNTKYINITIIEATDTITYAEYQTLLSNGKLQPMLNVGSSASTYEPYQGNTYNIDLPVENLYNGEVSATNRRLSTLNGGSYPVTGWSISSYVEVEPNKTYTINIQERIYCDEYDTNKVFIKGTEYGATKPIKITTSSTTKYIKFDFPSGNESVLMVEQGSKVNSYTPYGTTPIELCEIGDYQDYFGKSDGRNLLDPIVFKNRRINCYTINDDKTITQTASDANFWQSSYLSHSIILNSGTYTISVSNRNGSTLQVYNLTTSSSIVERKADSYTFTLTNDNQVINVKLYDASSYPFTFTMQIEKGSSASDYQPYGVDKWYLHKEIGKVVLDGDSSVSVLEIITAQSKFMWRNDNTLNMAGSGSRSNVLSNCFIGDTTIYGNNDKIGAYVNSSGYNNFAALLSTVGATTSSTSSQVLSLLKTWLSIQNVITYYPLETPTNIEITYQPLIDQLNALYNATSYSTQTNINQTNNDLPFIISASALKGE